MQGVVTAVPLEAPPARLGERFTLREDAPLRIGPSREARLRMGAVGAGDLLVGSAGGGAYLRTSTSTLRASLSGRALTDAQELPVFPGESLYVHPGLVLEFREATPPKPQRHPGLEAQLIEALGRDAPAAATWAVYRDWLEEVGDPLGLWLRAAPEADDPARLRQLRGLAESVRAGHAEVTWSPHGLLSSLTLTRSAVEDLPGLDWQLQQLSVLPVARFLPHLSLALFAGATDSDADALAAHTLEALQALEGVAALRSLSLGFVSQPRPFLRARAAWAALQRLAPQLPAWSNDALGSGRHALLSLIDRPTDVEVMATDVVLNPTRSDVGAGSRCLVRLLGNAPGLACTLHRTAEGQWVVFDESADPFRAAHGRFALRVNGALTNRATLRPGDVVEPVEGLRLRFHFRG